MTALRGRHRGRWAARRPAERLLGDRRRRRARTGLCSRNGVVHVRHRCAASRPIAAVAIGDRRGAEGYATRPVARSRHPSAASSSHAERRAEQQCKVSASSPVLACPPPCGAAPLQWAATSTHAPAPPSLPPAAAGRGGDRARTAPALCQGLQGADQEEAGTGLLMIEAFDSFRGCLGWASGPGSRKCGATGTISRQEEKV